MPTWCSIARNVMDRIRSSKPALPVGAMGKLVCLCATGPSDAGKRSLAHGTQPSIDVRWHVRATEPQRPREKGGRARIF